MNLKELFEETPSFLIAALNSKSAAKQVSKSLGYEKTERTIQKHHPVQKVLEWGENADGSVTAIAVYEDIPNQISITIVPKDMAWVEESIQICT